MPWSAWKALPSDSAGRCLSCLCCEKGVVFKDACEASLQQLIFRLWALRQRLPFPNMWPACTSDLGLSHTFSLLLFPSWWWWIAVPVGVSFECTWTSIKSIHPLPIHCLRPSQSRPGLCFEILTNLPTCQSAKNTVESDSLIPIQTVNETSPCRNLAGNCDELRLNCIKADRPRFRRVTVIAIETTVKVDVVSLNSFACTVWARKDCLILEQREAGCDCTWVTWTLIFNLYPWGNLSRNAF